MADSGFGKFGGIEGLRGCCNAKAIVEDRLSFVKTHIPVPLQVWCSEGVSAVRLLKVLTWGQHGEESFHGAQTQAATWASSCSRDFKL